MNGELSSGWELWQVATVTRSCQSTQAPHLEAGGAQARLRCGLQRKHHSTGSGLDLDKTTTRPDQAQLVLLHWYVTCMIRRSEQLPAPEHTLTHTQTTASPRLPGMPASCRALLLSRCLPGHTAGLLERHYTTESKVRGVQGCRASPARPGHAANRSAHFAAAAAAASRSAHFLATTLCFLA